MFEELHRGMEWLVDLCERWLESEGVAVAQESVAELIANDGVYAFDQAGNHTIFSRYRDRECLEDFPATLYHGSTNQLEACRAVVTDALLVGLEEHLRLRHNDALDDLEPLELNLFALPLISGQGVATLMAEAGLNLEWLQRKFERDFDSPFDGRHVEARVRRREHEAPAGFEKSRERGSEGLYVGYVHQRASPPQ